MFRLLLLVSLTLARAAASPGVCNSEEKTIKGKKTIRPGCWLSSQYKKRLCKIRESRKNTDDKVSSILIAGETLLGIAGDDFETSDAKCLRVAQAYKRAFELIVGEPTCQRTDAVPTQDQLLKWTFLLISHVAPVQPPSQARESENGGQRTGTQIEFIALRLFDLVRRSKLAGRFGDGGFMTIKGQLKTLEFFSKNHERAGELKDVLGKFANELNVWQNKGQKAGSKAGGWNMFFQRPQREGLSWLSSKPSFTFPPGYLLSLVCAVTSTSKELVEDDVLRILGLVDKDFNQEEAVENILNSLGAILVPPVPKSDGEPKYWLDVLRKEKELFSTMMEMDLFMATRRRGHKSVGKEVDAIEMGARVPGELFARLMYTGIVCGKFMEISKAVKGLEVFAKFVFFSQTLEKSVEVSKGGASNVDDEIVRDGASFFFNLLDNEKKGGINSFQPEFDNFINHIRRKNRRRIAGKFLFRTMMALFFAAKAYLLAPVAVGGLAALSLGTLPSSLDPSSWGVKLHSVTSSLHPSSWGVNGPSASLPSADAPSLGANVPSGSLASASSIPVDGSSFAVNVPSASLPSVDASSIPVDGSSLGAKVPSASLPSVHVPLGADVPSAPSMNIARPSVSLPSGDVSSVGASSGRVISRMTP